MTTKIHRLLKDTQGAGMVEYIILIGVVAILAIAAFRYFGSSVSAKIQQQGDTVDAVQGEE
jgi:pilus assembly protein Flp/PilA